MQNGYKKRTTLAGSVMLVEIIPNRQIERGKTRQKREAPTREAVARYNQKVAIKKLRLLINNNFRDGDFHATLTYKGKAPTEEESKKALTSFLRKARYLAEKQKKELKYILVTERGEKSGRIHHHIILSGLDSKEVQELWKSHGYVWISYLDGSGDYEGLAIYLLEESKKSLAEGLITKRWSASRNLEQPKVSEKPIKRWKPINEHPKEYKHYALMDWELVTNPVTGVVSQWAYYLHIPNQSQRKKE